MPIQDEPILDARIAGEDEESSTPTVMPIEHDSHINSAKENEDVAVEIPISTSSSPQSKHGKEETQQPDSGTMDFWKPEAGISNFWRILSYSTTLERFFMVSAVITSAASGVTLPLMNVVFGKLTIKFTEYFIPDSGVTKDEFLSAVSLNSLYLFLLFIAKFVLGYASIFAVRMIGIRISASMRLAYLKALLRQPVGVIDKLPAGTATDSLITASNTIQMGISDKLAFMIEAIALIISAYAISFKYSWALTLAASSGILFNLVLYSAIVPYWVKMETLINESNGKASAVAAEVFQSIRTIKSLCAENGSLQKYAKWVAVSRKYGLKMSPVAALQMAPIFFSVYAMMALTFWFGVKLYSEGHIDNVGTVVV